MEKRNVQRGCAFGYSLLTRKTRFCPLRIARKNVIDAVLGCLGGGDNPAFWRCGGRWELLRSAVFIGGCGDLGSAYRYMCACATRGACVPCVTRGVRCDTLQEAPSHYPAFAIVAVLARAASFSCSMVSCLTCSLSFPISCACSCIVVKSLSIA